jgi:hypothetical protein
VDGTGTGEVHDAEIAGILKFFPENFLDDSGSPLAGLV